MGWPRWRPPLWNPAAVGALRACSLSLRDFHARNAAAGRRAPLRCGGPPVGRTALRAPALAGAGALARHGTGRRACSVSGLSASVPGPGRGTHFACFARYVQPTATKSVHDPRCALGPEPCAPRRRRGAAPATRPRLCKHGWPSATRQPMCDECFVENYSGVRSVLGGQPVARLLRRRGAQLVWPRAQRASCTGLGAHV